MPFATEDGRRLDRIHLVQRAPGTFQLTRSFTFLESGRPESERYVIRAHDESRPAKGSNATDLASVPPFLWGLISSHGRQTAAALMHDQLWWESLNPDPEIWIRQRREADRLFAVALRESGSTWMRTQLLVAAVTLERYWGPRRWRAVAMALHALAGTASIWIAMTGLLGAWGLLLVALPALTVLIWGADAFPMGVLIYSGVLFLPIAAAALLGQYLLLLLDLVDWLLGRRRRPMPKAGPLGRTRRAKVRARNRVREAEHERAGRSR
ncbi:DUF1353 domain-containing protein [Naasia sp. SYSU D00948]|uniref:DUF1353 domain-containing protein n=1 Tax=Naasia sp. SYSU D00948 TaxID=2817379 RepID=UPI001B3015E4|nr:DUF1353 domain-containing protein [Naasia sp. SYSU D00948]